jgi:hypothetical protein
MNNPTSLDCPCGAATTQPIDGQDVRKPLTDGRPEFYKHDRVRVINEHGHIFTGVVTKSETRWAADRKPYVFYTVRPDGARHTPSIFPASSVSAVEQRQQEPT